jgi:5-keto 4-deoxyuronate isomerase
MQEHLDRLAALGIVPVDAIQLAHFVVVSRHPFAALLEHRDGRFVRIGTAGILSEHGLAMLLWRGEEPRFVAHGGYERVALPEEVEAMRQFSADLRSVLHSP